MTDAGVDRASTGQVEVSVIIALYNGERYIAALLASLVRQRDAPRFEVLVCDNGSTDQSRMIVEGFAGALVLRVVDAQSRRGQAYARNRGADAARGVHLLFLDQDDVVDDAYVAAMARSLAQYEILAARVDTELLNEAWHGKPRHLAQESRLADGALGPWGYGGTLSISKAAFTALGGFDETLLGAGEDVDLCWRAHMTGYDLHFAESAVLHYRFPDSVLALLRQGITYGRALREVNRKHAGAGALPFPAFRAALRVPYFAGRMLMSGPRATRGQYAFLLGRYWGLLNGRWADGRRQRLRPGERPSVLVLTASNDRRGAEIEAVALGEELRRRGFGVRVVALAPGRGERKLPIECLGPRPLAASTLVGLRRAARRADLVIAYGSSTLPACAIALGLTECPFVYRSISDPALWIRNDLHRRTTGLQMRRAVRVVAMWPGADASIRSMYRVPAGRTAVIPNARDPAVFRPPTPAERAAARALLHLDAERPVAAFVGRLSAEKRIDLAIEAIALTADYVLVVAGDGPDRRLGERRAARLGTERVRFVGELDNVLPVLHAADVLLITSDVEGMPGVAIEAALCGVPIVATDVGALFSMPGVQLTESGEQSLSEALESVALRSPVEREKQTAAYDWTHVGDLWAALIDASCRRCR